MSDAVLKDTLTRRSLLRRIGLRFMGATASGLRWVIMRDGPLVSVALELSRDGTDGGKERPPACDRGVRGVLRRCKANCWLLWSSPEGSGLGGGDSSKVVTCSSE